MVEYRRLLVNEDEFREVLLRQLAREEGCEIIPQIYEFEIGSEDPFVVHVHYQSADGRQVDKKIDANGAISAFIGHCLTSCIPISRVSKKTIKKTVGGIAMDMTISDVPVFPSDRKQNEAVEESNQVEQQAC